uniref:Uncharacterized protein n=1 Tax=Anguilla anguilla TaxID=7936 RepID=A0A0E9R4X1_ANGAN
MSEKAKENINENHIMDAQSMLHLGRRQRIQTLHAKLTLQTNCKTAQLAH